jgi:UDP-N-acetylmuramoyl-L-alanyl-D-glutamate--2,6-diaminopimelate ligase
VASSAEQGPNPRPRSSTVASLAEAIPQAALVGSGDVAVTGAQYDSRLVRPGDLFAALTGADFDGHDYIDRAQAAGAAALLVEEVAPLSCAFYGHPSRELTVIGLTGTDGKTTTSSLVEHILRTAGMATGIIGTVGIKVGQGVEYALPHQTTPESNLLQGYFREMVERGVTHAVIEATSHGLAMHRLDGTQVAIAGVTNMTHEHLEYHKTVENYWRAKAMLVERAAESDGVVVLNADDRGAMSALPYANGATVIRTSSAGQESDLRATDASIRADGTSFRLHTRHESVDVSMPLVGGFNIDNALIAIGIAQGAGVSASNAAAALATSQGVPGRMQLINEGQPFTVIVDYAHTPESLRKILTLLRGLQDGRVIVVSGSAGERDPSKRPLQGAVCAELADVSIFANEDPRNEDPLRILEDIAAGARTRGGVDGDNMHLILDRREAIARAFDLAGPGDLVLLAGKGHEQSIIVGYEHLPWDEAKVARELLRERVSA